MVFQTTTFLFLLQYLVMIPRLALSVHHPTYPQHHSLDTDKAALLEFKRTITSDPNSSLSNWNDSTHVCHFNGVRCNKENHRVWQLHLNDFGIVGPLSPFISNLTHLRILELMDNHLSGEIPWELSSLCHLRRLLLEGNNLHGQIPDTFSLLVNLTVVALGRNRLTGTIPHSFFSNCPLCKNVDLSSNFIQWNIPEIGNCKGLWNLNLYNNKLTGGIPFSITNASSMVNLDVGYNYLSGELPSKIVASLPDLEYLHLSFNALSSPENNYNLDPFFTALCNYTSLIELELEGMGLGGKLPTSIGNCVHLSLLLMQENTITGSIPPTLSNLTLLEQLNLTSNLLSGTIPDEISQLPLLEQLFLSHNSFDGPIPAALGQFRHIGLLDLSNNKFSGEIPKNLGNLTQISYLFLNNNLLSGSIPSSFEKCRDLYKLDLSYNRLTGNIPPQISSLREMRIFINLSHNFLDGDLPIELSKLQNVQEMDLSSNRFTGCISPQISSCIALSLLNLSHNLLVGELPESLGVFKNLEVFDVSVNQLSGAIRTSLRNIHTLRFLNLSVNNFSGTIPSGGIFDSVTYSSFLQNGNLCGSIPGIPSCHKRRKLFQSTTFLIIFCIVISFSVVCCMIGCRYLKVIIFAGKTKSETETEPEWIHNFPRITYKELFDATGGFDEQRKLGSGSSGRVYKGVLPDGMHIVVKVLQFQTGNPTQSFNRECRVMKRIRHRNLIRIRTVCSLPDFKALVLPYMANGSLESWLYPHSGTGLSSSGSSDLTLIQRVNICRDIAEGMAYLHYHSPVRVIHCDLKPSNILLNENMMALVSDFGISRLVMTFEGGNNRGFENMEKSTTNMLCGSIGYIAPEYGFGSNMSIMSEVYSFGILVLEMVTRKRPTDNMFSGGLSLPKWVESHYRGQIERVVDSSLVNAMRDQSPEVKKMWEVAIRELTVLGILCVRDSPSTRPTMLDANNDLNRLKRYLMEDTAATFVSSLGILSPTVGED